MNMKLTVIIVGYNSWHYLQKNLASLAFLKEDKNVEILYIDNGSTDESISAISYSYPNVRIISNETNNGVASARNVGMLNACPSEYFLFLDSDTEMNQEAFEKMVEYMDNHPEVGLCSCKLIGQNGETQHSCRKFPRVRHLIKSYLHEVSLRLKMNLFEDDYKKTIYEIDGQTEPFIVDYALGACHLIRRTAQIRIGFWDEKFFFGLEDADFCLRLKREGYKVVCMPQISILHAYEHNTSTTTKFFTKQTWKRICGFYHYFKKVRMKIYSDLKNKIHKKNSPKISFL